MLKRFRCLPLFDIGVVVGCVAGRPGDNDDDCPLRPVGPARVPPTAVARLTSAPDLVSSDHSPGFDHRTVPSATSGASAKVQAHDCWENRTVGQIQNLASGFR